MNTTSSISDEERVLDEFRQGYDGWRRALAAHRMAPPDRGFADRLAALADAALEEARVCRAADRAGFDWPPHRAAEARPPYELQPDTGRRGPYALWTRFDGAVSRVNVAVAATNIAEVADAYEELGLIARELAEAVRREDRAADKPEDRAADKPARARARRRSA